MCIRDRAYDDDTSTPPTNRGPSLSARFARYLHPARGRRRMRTSGPALLGRQGLGGVAAPRGQGLCAPAPALSDHAYRHGTELPRSLEAVSYTHLRAHETVLDLVC